MSQAQEIVAFPEECVTPSKQDDCDQKSLQSPNQKKLALADFKEGIVKWRVWLMLAYQDIKLRYRRSLLGPFWLTISMAITVYTIGFLYSHLLHIAWQQYYPFLASGMLSWTLVSTTINESVETFTVIDRWIKQVKLPYSVHVHAVITRNLIIFCHNLLVMIPLFIICHQNIHINFYSLLIFPGLVMFYINFFVYGLILAMIGARYRDLAQIIKNLVQVVFFVTPIMWDPAVLPQQDRLFIYLNPFYSFIELIRAPLLGTSPTLINLFIIFIVTVLGYIACVPMFIRYRSRIIYWV